MLRTILAVIGSLILLNVIFIGVMAGAWMVLGPDRAFRPGSWVTTGTWLAVLLGAIVLASVIAGAACHGLAGRANAPVHLAIIVLLAGVLRAATPVPTPPAGAADRADSVPMRQAITNARPPGWYLWANAFIGPVGVLIGGTLLTARSEPSGGA